MTPLERVQAAIALLRSRVDGSLEAPWILSPYDVSGYCEIESLPGTVAEVVPRPEGELIVALHRTIDAQLALLAYAATLAGPIPDEFTDLADAILGGAA